MNERREKSAVDHSPVGDEDSAVEPASSVEHEIDDPGGGADDNVPGGGSINSVEHELDDPGGVPGLGFLSLFIFRRAQFLLICIFPLDFKNIFARQNQYLLTPESTERNGGP